MKCKLFGLFVFLLLTGCKTQKNINITKLNFPEKKVLPKDFLEHINEQKKKFQWVFQEDTLRIKNYSNKFILDKIDTNKDHDYIYIAKYLFLYSYQEMIPELIKRITNDKEIGLENSADLIIMERVENGDLTFYGHGKMVSDDLFKVSGRANYLLKELTGENFGDVKMNSTKEELWELQKKWIEWLKNL